MENVQRVFGNTCRRLREEAGLTQDELGEAAGVSGAYVSEIERGNANPTLLTMQKLANGLHIHISVLANFHEESLSEEQIRENLLREISKTNGKTLRQWHSFIKKVFY